MGKGPRHLVPGRRPRRAEWKESSPQPCSRHTPGLASRCRAGTLELRIPGSLPPEATAFPVTMAPETFPTLLLIDEQQTVAATGDDAERVGIWSSHPAVAAIARVALSSLK